MRSIDIESDTPQSDACGRTNHDAENTPSRPQLNMGPSDGTAARASRWSVSATPTFAA